MKAFTKGMIWGAAIVAFGPKVLEFVGKVIDDQFGNTTLVKTAKKYYNKAKSQVKEEVAEVAEEVAEEASK